MADSDGKVRIIIDTNAQEAAKVLDDTSKSFNNTGKSAERAATVFDAFQQEVNDNIKSLRDMTLAGGQNTEEFKRLAKATQETQKQINLANKEVEKATGGLTNQSNGMQSLISMGKNLVGAYVGIQGAVKAVQFAMESVEAFRTQERAITSLNTTLKNAGVYSAEYSRSLQTLASSIQQYSNYGDEAILKAVAVGQSFMGQTRITDDLIKSVTDFAAAMDMDLEQAFTLVGKSIGSNTNALSRYGVELKKGMTDSEKMTAIQEQLAQRYNGSAKSMANATVQLQNSIGDLKEAFGSLFNSVVTDNQHTINIFVNSWIEALNQVRAAIGKTQNLNIEDTQQKIRQLYVKEDKLIQKLDVYKKNKYITAKTQQEITKVRQEIETAKKHVSDLIKLEQDAAKISIKPVKITDDFAPVSFGGGGGGSRSNKSSKSSSQAASTTKVLGDYDKLQQKITETQAKLRNLAAADVVDLSAIRATQTELAKWQTKLDTVNSYFESPKTRVQQLNDEIQKTTELLQQLYFEKGVNSEEFIIAKNQLKEYKNELQNMNTSLTNSVGIDWKNIGNSIKSNLSQAILTPLSEGETAFQRLGNVGLNIVSMIGQKIIENLLEQITLEQTLAALRTIGKGISSALFSLGGGIAGGQVGFGFVPNAKGNVFKNGNVIPFARGGVVSKPTVFPMSNGSTGLMGEAGAEAVMPLRRMSNGRLGVEADNNGNGTVINIYNQSQSQIETRKRDDGNYDIIVKRVNEALMNERTSSGFRIAAQREESKGLQAV